MPEVSKKTVSLRFVNSVELYELIIETLHPRQQLQSTSWKWHRETRCKMCQNCCLLRKRKFGFCLIISSFPNKAFIALAKVLAFWLHHERQTADGELNAHNNSLQSSGWRITTISVHLRIISLKNITYECKECSHGHDEMMLVSALFFFLLCACNVLAL